MLKQKTFVDLCLDDESIINNIGDYIDKWHDLDVDLEIYEYLGLTRREYCLWIQNPAALSSIIKLKSVNKMVPFLIQTMNDEIVHDFSFHLIRSIDYNNWYYNRPDNMIYYLSHEYCEQEKQCIPIGSVEFVVEYFKKYFNYSLKPKNIPYCLLDRRFTKRKVFQGSKNRVFINNELKFIKSNSKIKSFATIVHPDDDIPEDDYQISDVIDIDSEYRCFIFENELLYISNYSGDSTLFPNKHVIIDMIKTYQPTAPIAYTLDVGVNEKDGTFIIEVHDFFSCGL
jgi:hypothetical protein